MLVPVASPLPPYTSMGTTGTEVEQSVENEPHAQPLSSGGMAVGGAGDGSRGGAEPVISQCSPYGPVPDDHPSMTTVYMPAANVASSSMKDGANAVPAPHPPVGHVTSAVPSWLLAMASSATHEVDGQPSNTVRL